MVARTGKPARVEDYGARPGWLADDDAERFLRCAVAVPLRLEGRLWGCLGVASSRPRGLAADAEDVLGRFADLISVSLANARAQTRLRERAIILDSLQDGLVVLDPDGRVLEVNGPICKMTGFAASELVGSVAPYPFSIGPMGDELELTAPGAPVERMLARKDGSLLHVAASVGQLSEGGLAHGRAAVFTDVSESVFHARCEKALGEVAAACADGEIETEELAKLVTERTVELLGIEAAIVARVDEDRAVQVASCLTGQLPIDELLEHQPHKPLRAYYSSTILVEDWAAMPGEFGQAMVRGGMRSGLSVPIRVRGHLWGALAALSKHPSGLSAETETLLKRFAALLSVAVASADDLAALQRQATTDGLTGLLNHRSFQERLHEERQRALRHERPLSLVLFDLDGFKDVNDSRGHVAGDELLRAVAQALHSAARTGDIVARVGGDEFAVIAPDTDDAAAAALAERLRRAAGEALERLHVAVTLSAGVADLAAASAADDLVHLADRALYWAKHHGRDQTATHAVSAVDQLSDEERNRRLERARALTGLHALARAVDAKDPFTQRHAQRVAEISEELAVALGWTADRCLRLSQAALLHDVGKIGVPDAVLHKPGKLTSDEYEQVKLHSEIGARIAAGVLDDEQVSWVRSHHERPDGSGYPDGLTEREIPDGARIIAVADAFDVMTTGRPYQRAMEASDAVAELLRHTGTQFDAGVLRTLEDWSRVTDS
jgi:diguanylate cyclase (GGDEF)-like protein/PAS domain S-box-containing protein